MTLEARPAQGGGAELSALSTPHVWYCSVQGLPERGTGQAQCARPPSPPAAFCTDLLNGWEEGKETGTSLWNHIIPKLREEAKVK